MPIRLAVLVWGGLIGAYTTTVAREGAGFSTTDGSWAGIALLLAAGWSLTLASVIAWSRRNRRTPAVLLTLTSTAWFVSEWANPVAPALVFTTGLCLGTATSAVLFTATLALVDWLKPWPARIAALAGLVLMVGYVGVVGAATFDSRANGCPSCPTNLVDLGHDSAVWLAVSRSGLRSATVWLCAALLVLTVWFLGAGARRRRDAGWQVLAVVVFLALELVRTARSLDTGFLTSDAEAKVLWRYQAIALTALGIAVAADIVRARRGERSLTRVVRGLAAGDDLTADLAARLHDPDLVAAYPSADGARLLDAVGKPVEVPAAPGRSVTTIDRDGAPVAVLRHRADIPSSRVRDLAGAVYLALDHQRLRAQALAQLAELARSSARIIAAGDTERRRLERDLHDGAQQSLVALLLGVRLARASRPDDPALAVAEEQLASAVENLRTIAHGLYPVLLERAGLAAALQAMSETRLLRLGALPSDRLDPVVESTVYLLVDRATRNGPSTVSVHADRETVRLEISTEGPLPDLDPVLDRVAALDGTTTTRRLGDSAQPCTFVAVLPRSTRA